MNEDQIEEVIKNLQNNLVKVWDKYEINISHRFLLYSSLLILK